jgi:hypothetical protein
LHLQHPGCGNMWRKDHKTYENSMTYAYRHLKQQAQGIPPNAIAKLTRCSYGHHCWN